MINKKMTIRRIAQMFIGSVLLSAFVCLLCITGPMPVGSLQRDIALAVLPIIYIAWNFRSLRKCYLKMRNDKQFYVTNLCAEASFAAVSIAAYLTARLIFSSIMLRKAYSWAFLVTYLIGFSNIGISAYMSIGLFHLVLTVSIFLSPIGMDWVKYKEVEKKELLKRVPGMLEVNPLEQKSDDKKAVKDENEKENFPN